MSDQVDHPPHYNSHPSGVECITVTEHMNFNQGNAVKYIWRAGLKSDNPITDLRKAVWYLEREIERLSKPACTYVSFLGKLTPEQVSSFKALWEKTGGGS